MHVTLSAKLQKGFMSGATVAAAEIINRSRVVQEKLSGRLDETV